MFLINLWLLISVSSDCHARWWRWILSLLTDCQQGSFALQVSPWHFWQDLITAAINHCDSAVLLLHYRHSNGGKSLFSRLLLSLWLATKKNTVFVVLLYGRFKKSVSVFYVVRTIFFSVHLVLSPYVFPCLCIVFRTFKIYILFSFYKSRSRNEKVHNFCTFCCQNRKLNASNFFPMPCPRAWLWWVIPTPQLLKGISTLFSAPTERFWSLMIKWEHYDSVFIT